MHQKLYVIHRITITWAFFLNYGRRLLAEGERSGGTEAKSTQSLDNAATTV
jgi:hypothetical protein